MVKVEIVDKLADIEKLLETAIDARKASLEADREYRTEKARLRLETDWGEHFDKKPTDKDKEAFITFESMPLKEWADELKLEADYRWEIWELEMIVLRKK